MRSIRYGGVPQQGRRAGSARDQRLNNFRSTSFIAGLSGGDGGAFEAAGAGA